MLTNDIILDLAYFCELSYKEPKEVHEIFEEKESKYNNIINTFFVVIKKAYLLIK